MKSGVARDGRVVSLNIDLIRDMRQVGQSLLLQPSRRGSDRVPVAAERITRSASATTTCRGKGGNNAICLDKKVARITQLKNTRYIYKYKCVRMYIYYTRGSRRCAVGARKRCCSLTTFPSFRFSGRGVPQIASWISVVARHRGLLVPCGAPFFQIFWLSKELKASSMSSS